MNSKLAQRVASYKPNTRVLAAMRQIKILGTVGPSASGKTSVMKALLKLSSDFALIVDETTRAPRPGEKSGGEWLFRTVEEVLDDLKKGELVQVAIGPNGDLYCTRLSSYPAGKTGLIPLVPVAAEEFRRLPIGSFITTFIVPESYERWQQWFTRQAQVSAWDKAKKQQRLNEAKDSYKFALTDSKMHFVLNDEVEKAAQRLLQVAQGEELDNEAQAREIAEANYQKLQSQL